LSLDCPLGAGPHLVPRGVASPFPFGDHFQDPVILQKIKQDAESHLGDTVEEAVITCPAYFDDNQRSATKDACRIAGLEVARLVNEPTAASLAYGLDRLGEELRIAVIDLGGGTLDVTVMEFGKGVFEVKATSGDTQLGGTDMNQRVYEHLAERFQMSTGVDVRADRKAAAEALKQAAEDWRTTFDSIHDMIAVVDKDHRIVRVNRSFANAFKMSPKDILGKSCSELFHGKKEPDKDCPLNDALKTGKQTVREYYEPRLGMHIEETTSPVISESGESLYSVHVTRDITERKLAEEALHKHSERLHNLHRIDQAILQALESPEAVVQTAIQHIRKLLQCQRVSVGIFDQEKREASVYTIDTDSKAIVQEGKIPIEHICANIDTLRETKIEIIENRSPLLSTTQIKNSLHAEGIESSINVALVSALELYGVLNIGWGNSKSITPEELEIVGEVANQITIAIEKASLLKETKRYAGELEQRVAQRTSQLEEVNKELESFSYSVSHDLRAPLRHISGFVSLLTRRFDESLPVKAKHYLESIADSTHQMGTLIDDLLQFSRTSHQEMLLTGLDMNEVFKEALDQIKHDTKRQNIEWVTAPLPNVFGDKTLLRLVWINLLSNAVKFTGKKAKACIEIKSYIDGDEIVFSVKDNGVGFDMMYSQKLFAVFQRLHSTETFEGTGIGLANVKRIILKHGGRTWAEAEPDNGATFYFTLPNFKENKS